jgi:L-rhamnose mutarotase
MLRALRSAGWHNYSIFARPDGMLVGYVEAEDLDAAQAAMAETEVNARWQREMARFFVGQGSDDALELLDLVFNLEEQLEAVT